MKIAALPNLLKGWRPYGWIIAICAAAYSKALFFGFTYYDDDALILYNYSFISKLHNLPQLFLENIFHNNSASQFYRPLLAFSFMLDSWKQYAWPLGYHLTNILIHIAASMLVFSLLARLKYKRSHAFFFSLFFAVHPALAEAVAWIPGRNDSLLALFALSSFIFFLKFLETREWHYYLLHAFFFALALFTKESALALILICVITLFTLQRVQPPSFYIKRMTAAWLFVLIPWLYLRQVAVGGYGKEHILDMIKRVAMAAPGIIQLFGKIIFPFNLSVLPTTQDTTFFYGVVAVVLLLAGLFFSRNARGRFLIFGTAWFVLFLAPTFIVPTPFAALFLEHRLYLPMLGFIMVALEIDWVKNLDLRRAKNLAASGFIIALFCVISFMHSGIFRDRFSFWKSAVKSSPHLVISHINLGTIYMSSGLAKEAEREFSEAVRLDPGQYIAHNDLASLYLNDNRFKEAEEEIKKAISAEPSSDDVYLTLGCFYLKQNKLEEAEAALQKAIKINPRHFAPYYSLGRVFMEKGMLRDAEEALKKSAQINPDFGDSLFDLGIVYYREGKAREAIGAWEEALKINPNNIEALTRLAIFYYNAKDFSRARGYFLELQKRGISVDKKIIEVLDK